MAGVEDCGKPHTGLKRLYPANMSIPDDFTTKSRDVGLHDTVHLIVYDMTRLPKIHRIYDFIVSIVLVAI